MLKNLSVHMFCTMIGFSLLVLSGCTRTLEIPNLQTENLERMSSSDAVAYLNSVKMTSINNFNDICNFGNDKVEFLGWRKKENAKGTDYTHLYITHMETWTGTGRTGLWLHYRMSNPLTTFLDIPGCQVLGGKATPEQISKASHALYSLGAMYKR